MKLVIYINSGEARLGALVGDRVVDAARAGASRYERIPSDMMSFLESGDEVWQSLREVLVRIHEAPVDRQGIVYSLDEVRLAAPVPRPSKIICMGLNYRDHCVEQNVAIPKIPVTFVKYPSSLNDPDGPITWPAGASDQVDFEVELAVVMRRQARSVSEAEAMDYVAGYTILNDISARDVQFREKQWVRSKSFDSFCPLGPYLATPDEVGDPHELKVQCRLNGELMQNSNSRELIFRIPFIIAYLSSTCTLLPGDIISTGTPGGVGVFRKPPVFLKSGDVVEAEIEHLGVLRNPVA